MWNILYFKLVKPILLPLNIIRSNPKYAKFKSLLQRSLTIELLNFGDILFLRYKISRFEVNQYWWKISHNTNNPK